MGRQPCCDKEGVKRGPWTAEEDKKLISFILTHGRCCWRAVPKLAGLLRCGKSCRLRWTNYLRPDLKRGLLSTAEEQLVIDLHAKLGNRYTNLHGTYNTCMDAYTPICMLIHLLALLCYGRIRAICISSLAWGEFPCLSFELLRKLRNMLMEYLVKSS
jgi:hypothetical protein